MPRTATRLPCSNGHAHDVGSVGMSAIPFTIGSAQEQGSKGLPRAVTATRQDSSQKVHARASGIVPEQCMAGMNMPRALLVRSGLAIGDT